MSYMSFVGTQKITDPLIIKGMVAKSFGFQSETLNLKWRYIEIKDPRFIAMYLIRKYCKRENGSKFQIQFIKIAKIFGMKNHSTVFNAVKKVFGWIETDKDFREKINEIEKRLN